MAEKSGKEVRRKPSVVYFNGWTTHKMAVVHFYGWTTHRMTTQRRKCMVGAVTIAVQAFLEEK